MWQDGLALFIVVIAALVLLRLYAPVGLFRFGARRSDDDGSAKSRPAAGGCNGCGSASACFKVQVKAHPVASRRCE